MTENIFFRNLTLTVDDTAAGIETKRFIKHFSLDAQHRDVEAFPKLLGLRNENGLLIGAIELRTAANDDGSLELGLFEPIQRTLRRHAGSSVDHRFIIEIGQVAALYPGATRLLIANVLVALDRNGYRWTFMAKTAPVQSAFDELGLSTIGVGSAGTQFRSVVQRLVPSTGDIQMSEFVALDIALAIRTLPIMPTGRSTTSIDLGARLVAIPKHAVARDRNRALSSGKTESRRADGSRRTS